MQLGMRFVALRGSRLCCAPLLPSSHNRHACSTPQPSTDTHKTTQHRTAPETGIIMSDNEMEVDKAAAADEAGPSSKAKGGKRFEIKKWSAVAMWSWAVSSDECTQACGRS